MYPKKSHHHLYRILVGLLRVVVILPILNGCDSNEWPNRKSSVAENLRIDSLRFFPGPRRFVLIDSMTQIQFKDIHRGYSCAQIQEMGLDSVSDSALLSVRPKSRAKLPSNPDCAIDKKEIDSVLSFQFFGGHDSLVLQNSFRIKTDQAKLVRGKITTDSIRGNVTGSGHTFDSGRWFYRDTLGELTRQVYSNKISKCEFLNWAESVRQGDTVKVRLSWVTLDSMSSHYNCDSTYTDTIPVTSSNH